MVRQPLSKARPKTNRVVSEEYSGAHYPIPYFCLPSGAFSSLAPGRRSDLGRGCRGEPPNSPTFVQTEDRLFSLTSERRLRVGSPNATLATVPFLKASLDPDLLWSGGSVESVSSPPPPFSICGHILPFWTGRRRSDNDFCFACEFFPLSPAPRSP